MMVGACVCLLAISPGKATEFSLPMAGSGPTTIALAPDGTLWFTEQAGNRIGRMAPDGTAIKEFELPNPGSAPRIITIGADNNFWFTEHLGNRVGRITPGGQITESHSQQPAARDCSRSGRQSVVRRVHGRANRSHHIAGRHH